MIIKLLYMVLNGMFVLTSGVIIFNAGAMYETLELSEPTSIVGQLLKQEHIALAFSVIALALLWRALQKSQDKIIQAKDDEIHRIESKK